jgi:hypothetical protein
MAKQQFPGRIGGRTDHRGGGGIVFSGLMKA